MIRTTPYQKSVLFHHGTEDRWATNAWCVRMSKPRHGGLRIIGFHEADNGYVFNIRATKQMPTAYWWDWEDPEQFRGSRRVRDTEVAKLAIGIFLDRRAGPDALLDKLMERWPELTPAINRLLEGPR